MGCIGKSWRRTWLAVFVGLALSGCENPGESGSREKAAEGEGAPAPGWLVDFEQARARAREQNRPVYVLFTGSDWCPPCQAMHRRVHEQAEFREFAANQLVPLELDFPQFRELPEERARANRRLAERYSIQGFPTVVLVDAEGHELWRQAGYRNESAGAHVAALKKALER